MLDVDITRRLGDFALHARFATARETLVLFGPSGAGKSLTLAAIAGLTRPTGGRITLDGQPLFDAARGIELPPERRRVGYLPQGYALFPHLTVAGNIAFALEGLERAEARRRVADALDLLRLHGLESRYPAQLSGGQQQRTALARALVVRPRILLLDEPFAALDAEIRRSLRAELVELRREVGIAVLFVTHDLAEAHVVGDAVAVFDRGSVLQVGPTDEVFGRPASRRVAELTAMRNILPGRIVGAAADGSRVRLGDSIFEIDAPSSALPLGASVLVCIRPEHVLLTRAGTSAHNLVDGEILRDLAYGSHHTLHIGVDGLSEPIEVDVPAHPYEVMRVNSRRHWQLALRPGAIHLLQLT